VAPSEWERSIQRAWLANVATIRETPAVVAADFMTLALRDLFKVRLIKKEFAESLATLREQVRRAQMR
jgi:hypothetical protein